MLIAEAGLTLDPAAIALEKEQMYYDSLAAGGGVRPIATVIEIARQPPQPRARWRSRRAACGGSSTRTLEALGIADWFAGVVAAEDTARHKPEPDVFLEAARRIGVDPAACTVYEDTDIGLEAARRAGMTAGRRAPAHPADPAAPLPDRLPRCRCAGRGRGSAPRALPPPMPKNAAIFERSWFVCAAVGTGVIVRFAPRST